MKRLMLATVGLGGAVSGAGYVAHVTHPDEFAETMAVLARTGLRIWSSIEANPLPVAIAFGTFVLTVIYHKLKGKSLGEAVEVAATRVTVVTAPAHAATPEPTVVVRAKARTTRMQLLSDQIGLQNKQKWLPEAITNAEKDAAYTEQAVADAEKAIKNAEKAHAAKQKAHEDAVAKLAKLRTQKATGDAELAEIDAELKKLEELV